MKLNFESLLSKLFINAKNIKLYEEALTHGSYLNHIAVGATYERLEFLGDAVLELIVSKYLFSELVDNEGTMTRKRACLVCEDACVIYAKALRLDQYIRVGDQLKGDIKPKIIANVFEAFLAAIYLDLGLSKAKKVVLPIIISNYNKVLEVTTDYKTDLQEKLAIDHQSYYYETKKISGPAHAPVFSSKVIVSKIILGAGEGKSKDEAEKMAAKSALMKMSN